jgi:hypothetical protein
VGHLFLSYSSRDRERVRSVRSRLEAKGVRTFFDEANLRIGRNWPQALEQALNDASGVAVFVGSEIGNWQWPEIGFALDRQAQRQGFPVIPILLDGAETTRSFLFQNTWLDMRGDRFESGAAIETLIASLEQPSESSTPFSDFNPYRGLEVFDEPHAPFFLGRETFVQDLFRRLTEHRKNFVAVVGASGSGKSSVVRAGLLPLLRRQRPPKPTWDIAVLVPSERPWFRLADAVAQLRFPEKSDTELDIEVDKLQRALGSGELSVRALLDRILGRQGQFHRLLLVVDQFEELFTLASAAERQPFVDGLLEALTLPSVAIVVTLRADFYGQAIEADRRLSDLLGREQITLGRLTPEELRRTIEEPARQAHLTLQPGLVDLLLRDAGNEPGNLPLLQHALHELYARRQGRELTVSAYQDIGGIRHSIAVSAESEYSRLSDTDRELARSAFTQLVRVARPNEGVEDTRRRALLATLPSEAGAIVDQFASPRLRLLVKGRGRVISQENGVELVSWGGETVELAHEALIREWHRLRDWLNQHREFYLWRERLDQTLADYVEHNGNPDYLLQGALLREAEGKVSGPLPEPLGSARLHYIDASVAKRDQEERVRESLAREAREARAAQEQEVVRFAEAQRAQAEHLQQLAQAQAYADRRRSHVAIVAAVIGLGLGLWAIFG